MKTMTREKGYTTKICLKPGDRFSFNGENYVIPSMEVLRDIEDFKRERPKMKRYGTVEEMFEALDAE